MNLYSTIPQEMVESDVRRQKQDTGKVLVIVGGVLVERTWRAKRTLGGLPKGNCKRLHTGCELMIFRNRLMT